MQNSCDTCKYQYEKKPDKLDIAVAEFKMLLMQPGRIPTADEHIEKCFRKAIEPLLKQPRREYIDGRIESIKFNEYLSISANVPQDWSVRDKVRINRGWHGTDE